MWKWIFLSLLSCASLYGEEAQPKQVNVQYVLLALPADTFGLDVNKYWATMKANYGTHVEPEIRNYPPHCTVIGFFTPKHSVKFYTNKLKSAVKATKNKSISVVKLVQGPLKNKKYFDYIQLKSSSLLACAKRFAKSAGISSSLIKGQSGDVPYHITLTDYRYKKKWNLLHPKANQRTLIKGFENQIHLHASAFWQVALLKQTDNQPLTLVTPLIPFSHN